MKIWTKIWTFAEVCSAFEVVWFSYLSELNLHNSDLTSGRCVGYTHHSIWSKSRTKINAALQRPWTFASSSTSSCPAILIQSHWFDLSEENDMFAHAEWLNTAPRTLIVIITTTFITIIITSNIIIILILIPEESLPPSQFLLPQLMGQGNPTQLKISGLVAPHRKCFSDHIPEWLGLITVLKSII